ncbi:MFS transporter [Rubellimicrobium arenae]|uniref:MFS transporter n=1 Tax=Rubellimicrobium arenae TaxID=2817372 RepID=UPI001FEE4631|nr:MFS transporter [Rubellimicrobium arenae]
MKVNPLQLRSPRLAVGAMFLLAGGLFGVWASRIPAFVDRFQLSETKLGLLLLCVALGAIVSFPLAGKLSDRLGAGGLCRRVGALYVLAFWTLAFVPEVWMLGLCLALFGAGLGSLDVAMNAWGAEVEQHHGRPMMSSFHAMFSLGAGLGAASGYLAVRTGLSVPAHFLLAGGAIGLLAQVMGAIRWTSRRSASGGEAFALPKGSLVLVGLLAFCASVGEGAVADWSAVFLSSVMAMTEAQAALGYAAFSAAMVVMRLAGDRVIGRLGSVASARLSGLLAATGVATVLLAQQFAVALLGFTLLGIGYAVVAPLTFSRAAADPDMPPGQAIASVATLNYGGMLIGPPLIGFIAEGTSLRGAFLVLAILSLVMAALAPSLRTSTAAKTTDGDIA